MLSFNPSSRYITTLQKRNIIENLARRLKKDIKQFDPKTLVSLYVALTAHMKPPEDDIDF